MLLLVKTTDIQIKLNKAKDCKGLSEQIKGPS